MRMRDDDDDDDDDEDEDDEDESGYVILVTLITWPRTGGRRCRSESTWRPVASAFPLRASAEESTCERGAGGSWTPTGLSRGISLALSHPLRHPKRKRSLYRCGRSLDVTGIPVPVQVCRNRGPRGTCVASGGVMDAHVMMR